MLDVLQKPTVPSGPVNKFQPTALMKKTFFTTIVALCGLIAILSFLKDTVRKPKEVSRKLDAKLLQTLYHEKIYKTWKARIHRKKSPVLLTNPGTSFQYVEDMKKLARKVSSKMKEKNAKTLLVASVEENEGKSTVAANLALALAEESEKVLLIDADLRKPSQYKIFGLDQEEIQQFGEVLNGNAVFRFAVDVLKQGIDEILKKSDMTLDDIDYIVCHQANERIINHVKKKYPGHEDKFYINIAEYGNTSAASIPIALDELAQSGCFDKGRKLILAGFGAGLSWSSALIET